jgi:FMN reductase
MHATVAVVVGNPKLQSRTLAVAAHVARVSAATAWLDDDFDVAEIDLAEVGRELFDWQSTAVRSLVDQVTDADLAVIASPTYKASYTGLLKAFLDWFGAGQLAGVTAVPLMVGAAPEHALAVEVHLRPVLVELGAVMPTRGLYVLESQLDALDTVLDPWLATAGPQLARALRREP